MEPVVISIEEAYAEACQALGDEIVRGRLMNKLLAKEAIKEASEIVKEPDDTTKQSGRSPQNNGVSQPST